MKTRNMIKKMIMILIMIIISSMMVNAWFDSDLDNRREVQLSYLNNPTRTNELTNISLNAVCNNSGTWLCENDLSDIRVIREVTPTEYNIRWDLFNIETNQPVDLEDQTSSTDGHIYQIRFRTDSTADKFYVYFNENTPVSEDNNSNNLTLWEDNAENNNFNNFAGTTGSPSIDTGGLHGSLAFTTGNATSKMYTRDAGSGNSLIDGRMTFWQKVEGHTGNSGVSFTEDAGWSDFSVLNSNVDFDSVYIAIDGPQTVIDRDDLLHADTGFIYYSFDVNSSGTSVSINNTHQSESDGWTQLTNWQYYQWWWSATSGDQFLWDDIKIFPTGFEVNQYETPVDITISGILTDVSDPPIIDWDGEQLTDGTNTTFSEFAFAFNCSDTDTTLLNAHIIINGDILNSTYNFTTGINQTLTAGFDQGNNNITLMCDDKQTNTTAEKNIFVDSIEPLIFFIIPSVNGTNFDADFNYHINISDTNLYSSNVTTINSSGSLMYNNYTEDYNVTDVVLIDVQDISAFAGGTYDLCIEVCDAHTSNRLSDEFSYNVDGKKLDIKDTPITFNGDIKELKITQQEDKIDIQMNLYQKGNYSITLDQCFDKVSNTRYYGHFVCKEKNIWFDTMPFQANYYIIDQYGRWNIYLTAEEKEVKFQSAGELNCKTECIQYTGDADEPDETLISPSDQTTISNTTIDFRFNVTHPPPDKINNCTIEIDGIQNETLSGSPFLTINTELSIVVNNLFDPLGNRTITWTINCTDNNGHTGNEAEIWELIFETNISGTPETNITTAQALNNLNTTFNIAIFFVIWIILLILAVIFFKMGIFQVLLFAYGIGLAFSYDFNGEQTLRILFMFLNLMIFIFGIIAYGFGFKKFDV